MELSNPYMYYLYFREQLVELKPHAMCRFVNTKFKEIIFENTFSTPSFCSHDE